MAFFINSASVLRLIVLQALEAGKHVVVDKPFCVTLEEANKLVSTASSLKQVLAVFHNRRWDCDFLMLQREIQNGTVGEVCTPTTAL